MFKILTAFVILVLVKLIFNPKFDIIDNNLLILWYGYTKRKYIKLFRI